MDVFVGESFTHEETSGDFPGDPHMYAKTIYKVVARFDDEPDEEYVTVQNFGTREDAEAHLAKVEEYGPDKSDFIDSDKWYTKPRFDNRSLEESLERAAQRERERRGFGGLRY